MSKNFVTEIIKNTNNQIKYKNKISTGEITKVNNDGTYSVKIANANDSMPNIETLNYGDVFSLNEIVDLGNEYGNKESIKILGHSKKIKQNPVEVEVDYSGGARVETWNAYSITATTAYVNGEISIIGVIGNCIRRGFHYGTTTDYGSDVYEDGSFGEGTYNLQITGLTAEKTYHYQAYVTDANGDEQVGEDKTFSTEVMANFIFVVYKSGSDYYLNRYSYDGVLDSELGILSELTEDVVRMSVDSNQNVYILHQAEQSYPLPFLHTIYKYDKDGNHLLTKSLTENEMVAYINPDGYLYTKVWTNDFVTKRNLNDLSSAGTFTIISGHKYRYLTFDSNGYLYTYDENYIGGMAFLKWELGVGEVTHYTRSLTGLSAWSAWVVEGDYLAGHEVNLDYQTAFTIPKNLSTDLTTWTLDGIKYSYDIAGVSGYFIFLGKSTDNKLVLEKYNAVRTRQWSTEIVSYTLTHSACAVAAYPF